MALSDKAFGDALTKINRAKPRNIDGTLHLHINQEAPQVKEGTIKGYNKRNGVQEEDTGREGKEGTKEGAKQGTIITENPKKNNIKSNKPPHCREYNKNINQTIINDSAEKKEIDMDLLNNSFVYANLSGIPKKIVDVIHQVCSKLMVRETPPITFQTLVNLCDSKKNSVKVARKRLNKKGLLTMRRSENTQKGGRSSELTYRLSESIIKDINRMEQIKQGTDKGTIIGSSLLSSSSNINNEKKTPTTHIPEEWLHIKYEQLQSIFYSKSFLRKQFFGRAQITAIYKSAGEILTAEQVETSIKHFSFGLKYLLEREPYSSMKNPGAILVEHLKNGDEWLDPNYLTLLQEQLIGIYNNFREKAEAKMKEHYEIWVGTDRDVKFKAYQANIPSNAYYSDKIFKEMAFKDYKNNIWEGVRLDYILNILGEEHRETFTKIEEVFNTKDL